MKPLRALRQRLLQRQAPQGVQLRAAPLVGVPSATTRGATARGAASTGRPPPHRCAADATTAVAAESGSGTIAGQTMRVARGAAATTRVPTRATAGTINGASSTDTAAGTAAAEARAASAAVAAALAHLPRPPPASALCVHFSTYPTAYELVNPARLVPLSLCNAATVAHALLVLSVHFIKSLGKRDCRERERGATRKETGNASHCLAGRSATHPPGAGRARAHLHSCSWAGARTHPFIRLPAVGWQRRIWCVCVTT